MLTRDALATAASTNDTLAESLGDIDKILDSLGLNLSVLDFGLRRPRSRHRYT